MFEAASLKRRLAEIMEDSRSGFGERKSRRKLESVVLKAY
jgi:hypothetical protein